MAGNMYAGRLAGMRAARRDVLDEARSFQGLRATQADQRRADERLAMDRDSTRQAAQDRETRMGWLQEDRAISEQDRVRKQRFEDQDRTISAQDREMAMADRDRKLRQEGILDVVKAAVEGLPKEMVLSNQRVYGGSMPIKDFARLPDGGLMLVNPNGEKAQIDADTVQAMYRRAYGLPAESVGSFGTFKGLRDMGEIYDLDAVDPNTGEAKVKSEERAAIRDALKRGHTFGEIADEIGLTPRGQADLDTLEQEYRDTKVAYDAAKTKASTGGFLRRATVSSREQRKLDEMENKMTTTLKKWQGLKTEIDQKVAKADQTTIRGLRASAQQPAAEVVMSPQQSTQDVNQDGKTDETDRIYALAKKVVELYDGGDPNVVQSLEARYGARGLDEFRAIVKSMQKKIQVDADGFVGAGR